MAMTAQQDRRLALYDAYCAVPDHQRAEIIDGTLYVSPRPAPRHANASSVLGGELNGAFHRSVRSLGSLIRLRMPSRRAGCESSDI